MIVVRLVSKENHLAFIFKRSARDQAGDKDKTAGFKNMLRGGNGWNFGHFGQKSLFNFIEQI